MRGRRLVSAAFWLAAELSSALGLGATASAQTPAVTRPSYESTGEDGGTPVAGTTFFLATQRGAVAVGAAHSFDRAKLAAASEVVFELGRSRVRAASATRVLVEPGLAFSAPGGSLRTDLVVFALEAPPAAARVLEPGAAPKQGARVRVLGIPANNPHDEDDIFGSVESAAADRIEVLLDVFYDLRGWGGAPLLSHPEGKVLGFIQAATPDGRKLRVTATPIGVVTQALARPLEGGRGRALAALVPAGAKPAAPPVAAARAKDKVVLEAPGAPAKRAVSGALAIEIEHPSEGAIFGDPLGAFVAGRATEDLDLPKIEVAFVLDTSGSTTAPSGMDVNGNGVVGDARLPVLGSVLGIGSTDPGDSILAAEVAAARQFLARLDPRYTRVCLVSYAGLDHGTEFFEQIDPDSVLTEVPLTSDYKDVERALSRVLSRGPGGLTYMSGGVDQATVELLGLKGSFSTPDRKAEKIVVFLTDGQPTLPRNAPEAAVVRAARRAKRAGIRVFTYGIGEEALAAPDTIMQLAEITRGVFTPVRDAKRLGDLVEQVDLAGIETVTLQNKTLGQPAYALELAADGGFGALVPLKPGKNELVVTATTSDGRVASKNISVHYAPGAQSPPIAPESVARRNRLLEERLIDLKRTRHAAEDVQAEEVRKQLELEIEKARAERKELELKVQKQEGAQQPPAPDAKSKP